MESARLLDHEVSGSMGEGYEVTVGRGADANALTLPEEDDDEKVKVPVDDDKTWFSFRTFWFYTGPGFLMSIAYLDPGNIESDLRSGSTAQYKLLWVLLCAHIVGMLLQRMSARLGVVTGQHMAEVAYKFYPRVPRLILWLMIEIAIWGSDMQEVIGTAIALLLLFRLPLVFGVIITMMDTIIFLLFERQGIRLLELFFCVLISIMAITFGFEYVTVNPDHLEVIKGIFVPICPGCGQEQFIQAISVVGAVIMPHNLYLHSALVKSRKVGRDSKAKITQANKYFTLESALALVISFFINVFVVSVFAYGLYEKTNNEVRTACLAAHGIPDTDAFPANNETVNADLYKGGIFLGCEFGKLAMIVWGVGILAAGQSSTMTGTYTGQFVMEGFLQLSWPRWQRLLVTRIIAILPTLVVVLWANGVESLTGMNDLLNCVQMIQLPFALIPIITFTSSEKIMHDFRSSKAFQIFALGASVVVIGINIYFIQDTLISNFGTQWYIITALVIFSILYFSFIIYLAVVCLMACGFIPEIIRIGPLTITADAEIDAPWKQVSGVSNDGFTSSVPFLDR